MLQTRTVESRTLGLLKELMSLPMLDSFYLVGGTALALQLGHRVSIDLDLFTLEPFDPNEIIEKMSENFDFSVVSEGSAMVISTINDIKVDFVKMSYPILFPSILDEQVRMLDIRDIAAMKLKAVTQRGSKKDFYDIYFLLQIMSLDEIIQLFKEKFKQYEIFHVIKSLTYFEDAENNADPILFDKKITWQKVKTEIIGTVKMLE
jgi:predicted nucleotidyltransferase component of viral defense system